MRHLFAALAALALGCATSTDPAGYLEVREGTTRITCEGSEVGEEFGSRLARGPVLVAPGGARKAWAEVEARALLEPDGDGTCQNVSRLWISDGGAPRAVFEQRPGWEGRNGNSLELIDWSHDGSRLLMELHTWTYPTDPPEPLLLEWSSASGEVEQLEPRSGIASVLDRDCALRVRAEGFTERGETVLRVEPFPDQETPSCVTAAEYWSLNRSGTTQRLGRDTEVRSWSTPGDLPPLSNSRVAAPQG